MKTELISAIRFGVFVQDRELHDWEWKSIDLLRAEGASCLFIGSSASTQRWKGPTRTFDGLVLRVGGVPSGRATEVDELGPERYHPWTACVVDRTADGSLRLGCGQAAELSEFRMKFILFFGCGEAPRGLAECAELGLWRFTCSSGVAGGYPFIYDLCRGADVVDFGLEQIAKTKARRRLLLNGWFRARSETSRSVVTKVLSQASRWPLLVLKHVLLNGELPYEIKSGSRKGAPPHRLATLVSLLYRELSQRLASKLASYLVLETWNVGLVRMDFRSLLAGARFSDVVLLPTLRLGHYLADPFVLSTSPQLKILAEEYNDFGVGRIVEVAIQNPLGKPQISVDVRLQSRHHLSYPFIFREQGVTYCLPECHQSNGSLLYRYDDGKLTPVIDLVPGARVTDGTILFHDGLYWLFCGLEDDNDQVNLHLFFSRTLRGTWSPHPLNPVKTDVRSARSAGPIIVHDGALFRPAQDCSRSYGYGVSINRIDCLSVTGYQETVVATVGPQVVSKSCKGLHTLSLAGDLMVIDVRLDAVGFKPLLVRLLRRMKRIASGPLRAIPFWSRSA